MLVNSIADSLGVAGLGIAIVMAVLALLALFLVVLGRVMRSRASAAPAEAAPVAAVAAAPVSVAAPAPVAAAAHPGLRPLPEHESQGELTLIRVDEPTAAMLMAIVADELQTPLNCLRFKQIKAL